MSAGARPDPFFSGSVVFRRFFVAGWVIFTVMISAQRIALARIDQVALPAPRAVLLAAVFATLIALLALAGLATAHLLPFRGEGWLRPLVLTAVVGTAVSVGFSHLEAVVRSALGDPGVIPVRDFPLAWVTLFPGRSTIFFNLVAVGNAVRLFREAAEREVAAARLEARIAESRLELAKLRMQPRLLFGMLDVMAQLVRTDVTAADRALARLSDFLRATLYRDAEGDATLEEEAELLRLYLGVVGGAAGRAPTLSVDLDDAAADAPIPHLLLETVADVLLARLPADGAPPRLSLAGRGAEGRLRLEAWGPAAVDAAPAEAVTALAERLAALYGDGHRMELRPAAGGGAALVLDLPLRGPAGAEDEPFDAYDEGGVLAARERR